MIRRPLFLFALALLLSGCTLPFINQLPSNAKSGLQVSATPQVTVFLDGKSLGMTPIVEKNLNPGPATVKLVPDDSSLPSWETRVTLTPKILTVIDRKFGSTSDQSHGYVITFEKLANSQASQLAATSLPDKVTLTVDGNPQGFTPLTLDSIAASDHTILFTSPGFEDKTIRAQTVEGYRLTIFAQLSQKAVVPLPTPTLSLSPPTTATPSALPAPYVEILSTPTGWLRVRSQPSSAATELGRVNPGERFPHISTQSGWYQIQFQATQAGWVSAQYAKLVEK